MRILLDEDLDVRLRHHFGEGAVVETVSYRGWKGLDNGELLRLAEQDFDVLVTMDKNIPHQRSLSNFDIAVVILRAHSKDLADLIEVMPEVRRILPTVRVGGAVEVFPPDAHPQPGPPHDM